MVICYKKKERKKRKFQNKLIARGQVTFLYSICSNVVQGLRLIQMEKGDLEYLALSNSCNKF